MVEVFENIQDLELSITDLDEFAAFLIVPKFLTI